MPLFAADDVHAACQNVFKLEEYETAVAPFLEKALHLPRGAASASEETRVLARLGAFRDANDVDEDDWKAEQDAAASVGARGATAHRANGSRRRLHAPRPPSTDHDSETRRDVASDPRSALEFLTSNTVERGEGGVETRLRTPPPRTTESSPARGRSASRAPPSGIAPTARGAAAPVDRRPALPAACSWADLRPRRSRVVKTYADDFEELGYSSAPLGRVEPRPRAPGVRRGHHRRVARCGFDVSRAPPRRGGVNTGATARMRTLTTTRGNSRWRLRRVESSRGCCGRRARGRGRRRRSLAIRPDE